MNATAPVLACMISRKWPGREDSPAKVSPIAIRSVRIVTPITDVRPGKC